MRVMTAPLAIIKINSVAVGKMKNVRVTETIRRGRVTGLGVLTPSELPALEWQGSLSCSSYTIDFRKLANTSAIGTFRNSPTVDSWALSILMQEAGLEICIQRKVKVSEPDGSSTPMTTEYETFAKVNGAFASRESFDIQEGQISGRDTEFEYLEPILYND